MKITLKKTIDLGLILGEIKNITSIKDGKISYHSFRFYELKAILQSYINFPENISNISKNRITDKTIGRIAVFDFNSEKFENIINDELKIHLKGKKQKFFLLTSLSISSLPFRKLKINNSYAERLTNTTADLDTLVKIVRHEYFGPFNKLKELNKTTFNSLESTGEIDLLGRDLAKNVQKYYINRGNDIRAMTTNAEIYYNLLESFMLKYPSYWFAIQGHLLDLHWKNVDKKELYGAFNGLLTVRLFNLNVRKNLVEKLIDKTEKLIDELE